QDGGFWQTITGTLELNESIVESRQRELKEEVGITNAVYDNAEVNRFAWQKKDWTVVEVVFSARTESKEAILNPKEHTEYKWLPIDEAIDLVEKDQTKECLKKFKEIKLLK
ncbi:MAG: NUDIX domain-containing protein, partial [Patescibacteria group bacterium]